MWLRTAILLGVLAPLVPATAVADDAGARSSGPASKIRLMGNMGVASAIGEMGGTLTYSPRPEFQVELGTGIGYSGLQLSLMPKLAIGGKNHRVSIGAGPSMGIGSNPKPSQTCISYWLNAEVGYEYRSASGLSFLVAVGIFRGLAGEIPGGTPGVTEAGEAVRPEPASDFSLFPQGRIAFGRWF
jgi:hypothetical protein